MPWGSLWNLKRMNSQTSRRMRTRIWQGIQAAGVRAASPGTPPGQVNPSASRSCLFPLGHELPISLSHVPQPREGRASWLEKKNKVATKIIDLPTGLGTNSGLFEGFASVFQYHKESNEIIAGHSFPSIQLLWVNSWTISQLQSHFQVPRGPRLPAGLVSLSSSSPPASHLLHLLCYCWEQVVKMNILKFILQEGPCRWRNIVL